MSDNPTNTDVLDVDAAWTADWAAVGMAALERYLAVQAAFSEYLDERDSDLDCDHDDRRPDV